jgi:hypothetical protein
MEVFFDCLHNLNQDSIDSKEDFEMAQEIYKVWFMKYKEPWYKLSKEEQDALMAKNMESAKQCGVELVMLRACGWASEEWLAWGVEKYPDLEAVQKHANNLFSLNWFEYIESKTYLGVEMPEM